MIRCRRNSHLLNQWCCYQCRCIVVVGWLEIGYWSNSCIKWCSHIERWWLPKWTKSLYLCSTQSSMLFKWWTLYPQCRMSMFQLEEWQQMLLNKWIFLSSFENKSSMNRRRQSSSFSLSPLLACPCSLIVDILLLVSVTKRKDRARR